MTKYMGKEKLFWKSVIDDYLFTEGEKSLSLSKAFRLVQLW